LDVAEKVNMKISTAGTKIMAFQWKAHS